MEDTYATKVDHSQDFEIRTTKDGRVFGMKNLRQEFEDNVMIFKADISGDIEAGKEYLEYLGNCLVENLTTKKE